MGAWENTFTVGVAPSVRSGRASFVGASQVSAITGRILRAGRASLNGATALAAPTGRLIHGGRASFGGASALAPVGRQVKTGTAVFAGASELAAVGTFISSGTSVDLFLDLSGITPGATLSAANLTSASVGSMGGTWTTEYEGGGATLDHTTVETAAVEVARGWRVGGGAPFTTFDREIRVDMAGRNGDDGLFDTFARSLPADSDSDNVSVAMVVRFPLSGDPANSGDANIDVLGIWSGSYAVAQYYTAGGSSGAGTLPGGVRAHGQTSGSGDVFADFNQVPDASVYYILTVRHNRSRQMAEYLVQALDGTPLFYGEKSSDLTQAFSVEVHDYLSSWGGILRIAALAIARGAKAIMPLDVEFSMPAPSALTVVQIGATAVRLSWASGGYLFRIGLSADGGAQSEIEDAQRARSIDLAGLSLDTSYVAGVTATILTHVSPEAATSPFTLNEPPAGYTDLQQSADPGGGNHDPDLYIAFFGDNRASAARIVAAGDGTVEKIAAKLVRSGDMGATKLTAQIWSHDVANNRPLAPIGRVSWEVAGNDVPTSADYVEFEGCSCPILNAVVYWVVIVPDRALATGPSIKWIAEELAVPVTNSHMRHPNATWPGTAWANDGFNSYRGHHILSVAT